MAQKMETPSSMEDLTQRLPDDLLVSVLRRLQTMSPPSLAASRCVCKAWSAVVDAHRLLADLPPYSVTGIFVHLCGDTPELLTEHFSPVKSPMNIAVAFGYVDPECSTIKQHCNGLLLLDNEWPRRKGPIHEKAWVLNAATRRWTRLPPPPPMCTPGMEDVDDFYMEELMRCHGQYLVFDPAVSPHYEVFLVTYVPPLSWPSHTHYMDDHVLEREWPPSTFVLPVFSSRTKQWEERPFVRQGEAAATIGFMFNDFTSPQCHASYWQGALYVHQNGFILRMTLSNRKYQVIDMPPEFCSMHTRDRYLGKSEKGVYCALLEGHECRRLRILYLDETCDEINWRSKCDINLGHLLPDFSLEQNDAPTERWRYKMCSLLGFHPNQEIIYLHTPLNRVMAYHFDSSKMEALGCLPVEPRDGIYASFPYTLCLAGEFSGNELLG